MDVLHLLHVSCSGSCDLLRRARARGVRVSAGVCALNLALDDEELKRFDTSCKVNPPLRSIDHIQACIEALQDDTLSVISSGHVPRAPEKKMDVLHAAPFGASCLETNSRLGRHKTRQCGALELVPSDRKIEYESSTRVGAQAQGDIGPPALTRTSW